MGNIHEQLRKLESEPEPDNYIEKLSKMKLEEELKKKIKIEVMQKNTLKATIIRRRIIVILIIIVVSTTYISNLFLTPKIFRSIVFDSFNTGKVSPVLSEFLDYKNGFVIIGAYATNKNEGMNSLKKAYSKMNGKLKSSELNKILIKVYSLHSGDILFTSHMFTSEIKLVNWKQITNYGDFIQKAYITQE